MPDADVLYAALADAVRHDPPDGRKGFGAGALKANGKIFAMLFEGTLVVKLHRERVAELVETGTARPFDGGKGRVLKEWASLPPAPLETWIGLAEEARSFVSR